MTGFGQGAATDGALSVRVEVGSVNRKNLDVQISLPRTQGVLEARCQRAVSARLHRGRVQVRVQVARTGAEAPPLFDAARADELLRQANAFAAERGLEPVRAVSDLLRAAHPLREDHAEDEDPDALWAVLEPALNAALDGLCAMREEEGAHLRGVLEALLRDISAVIDDILPIVDSAREALVSRLRSSLAHLGTLPPEAEARLLQEIALHGERADVREEIDRIRGHLAQFQLRLDSSEPSGRAMDFLCQELSREFNTLSVKAATADINRLALLGRERVEMLREQVQNVE